jgi:hypothetical protein
MGSVTRSSFFIKKKKKKTRSSLDQRLALRCAPELGRRSESVEWEMRVKIKLAPE